jgi:hypothetical protein
MQPLEQDFASDLDAYWRRYVTGAGHLEPTGASLRFVTRGATTRQYSNAQIDDYQGLARRRFPWNPPLRLTVRARFSHPAGRQPTSLQGTAGFGFWNDPFLMTGRRLPALPGAAWFFYASAPSNMKLDLDVPGHGWKAATLDARRATAAALVPLAPLAVLLMNVDALYRRLWPPIQRALRVGEANLQVGMTRWHTYVLEWGVETARFTVDGQPVLAAPAPRGPLGFVMWLDNQYLVATPQGRFRWGVLDAPGEQWMEVERLQIEPLPSENRTRAQTDRERDCRS